VSARRAARAQVGIAMRAAGRLSAKLEAARGSGRHVDMEEEFRLLTLQVIGEAVLSLPPEECDRVRGGLACTGTRYSLYCTPALAASPYGHGSRHWPESWPSSQGAGPPRLGDEGRAYHAQVFPQLYLPVMAESNLRAVRPWRAWLPTPGAAAHLRRLARLNAYIRRILRARWAARCTGAAAAKPDILDRLLASIEARPWGAVRRRGDPTLTLSCYARSAPRRQATRRRLDTLVPAGHPRVSVHVASQGWRVRAWQQPQEAPCGLDTLCAHCCARPSDRRGRRPRAARTTRRWRRSCASRSRRSCWRATRPAPRCSPGRCTSSSAIRKPSRGCVFAPPPPPPPPVETSPQTLLFSQGTSCW
jgi:hypothetical protein